MIGCQRSKLTCMEALSNGMGIPEISHTQRTQQVLIQYLCLEDNLKEKEVSK